MARKETQRKKALRRNIFVGQYITGSRLALVSDISREKILISGNAA